MRKKRPSFLVVLAAILFFLFPVNPLFGFEEELLTPTMSVSLEEPTEEPAITEAEISPVLEETPVSSPVLSPAAFFEEEALPASNAAEAATISGGPSPEATAETASQATVSPAAASVSEEAPPKKSELFSLWNDLKRFLRIRTLSLTEKDFQADEKMKINLRDYKAAELRILVFDRQGKEVEIIAEEDEGDINISPQKTLQPGRYTLRAFEGEELVLEENFTWGVLAINTHKSIYQPQETAKLAIAVLDEEGIMVCDAKVELRIKSEKQAETLLSTDEGTIKVNPECRLHGFTLKPDYEAEYQVGEAGVYQMELTAETKNGRYTVNDSFEVKETVPFEVERASATRIYPPASYPVVFKIKANQDFKGEIVEIVPQDFEIIAPADEATPEFRIEENDRQEEKLLIWSVDWREGETRELSYQFKAPDISPQFYLLGPLAFRQTVKKINLPEEALEDEAATFPQQIDPATQTIADPLLESSPAALAKESVNVVITEEIVVFQEARRWQLAIDASQTQTFTSSGSWQAPAGVTQVTVECWGGGGGGGGPSTNKTASSGGGGGAYSKKTVSVTGGNSYSYTVGGGGAGGNGGNGSAGGDTYWVNTSTVLAKGGSGGSATTPGGAGGAAASGVGETKYSGGNGSSRSGSSSGAGGGGAGSTGNGGNASGTTAGTGTSENGGNGGAGRTSAGTPYNGSNYGGGGGGNYRRGSSGATGGNGAPGLIRITYELLPPSSPTNVSATDGTYTDKVVVTWTKSTGATGYKVYEGSNLLATLGDVATYDDTTAPAPTITPGTASASDGTSADYVALSLSGQSANNGSSRTYKVIAYNDAGDSGDSNTDTGYRGVGSLTYQWQRSLADSDADYSNIDGATTASYNDTGAPANGDGRYYRCVLNATGASQQTSTSDRGYRAVPLNQNPNSPTSLAQKKTDDTSLAVGAWTNETSVKFSATVSDPDSADTLYLCVEKDILGTSFSGSEDLCGSGVAYSGTAVEATVTISGITDANQYHWQARVKDEAGAYSSWVSFGENLETEQDFGVDTSAPSGGTVYDGEETGVDKSFNNGSLSQLSANWANFDAGVSGLDYYQYAIGTSAGGTDVKAWTSAGASTAVTATDLTLVTSTSYYFSVRAVDKAGNIQSPAISSNGQLVAPSLIFSVSPDEVSFTNLNAGNDYTDSKTVTLTTSTNAYNGYLVRTFITDYLRSADDAFTIADFDGGTYEAPGEWLTDNRGFGYHSSDALVGGVNKFNSTPCPGGGSPPCFAPFSHSGPGEVIADHTANVSGIPISNEEFMITLKVKTDAGQPASTYSTNIIYTITAKY